MREFLFWMSTPLQKLMQKLHPPYAQTTVAEAEEILSHMEVGDILVSREKWHFTNLFIPGFWSHCAIYGEGKVIEAVAPYVQVVDFKDWVIEKHYWCVLRLPVRDGQRAYVWALKQVGCGYDYQFSSRLKRGMKRLFYCSGLVYKAYREELQRYLGRHKSITPEDFYKLSQRGLLKVVREHRDK